MAEGVTSGDLALMRDNGFGGNGLWVFALLLLMFGGNGFGWGNRGPVGPEPASADQVAQGFNNQNMQQILLSSANNNYETAQLINNQTNLLMQQNNTNLINAIQGFNAVNISLQNMMAKLESCCCDIKTQMLQNRYEDERAKNGTLQNEISNFQQSQYILGQMGRWVAWLGSGSQAAAGAGT
jgi:hypothetical protein